VPRLDQRVGYQPRIVFFGPIPLAHNVIHPRADGVVPAGLDGSLLRVWCHQRLRAGPQAGADQHAVGAQRQPSSQSATIGNSTSSHYQRFSRVFCGQVDDVGHECEG